MNLNVSCQYLINHFQQDMSCYMRSCPNIVNSSKSLSLIKVKFFSLFIRIFQAIQIFRTTITHFFSFHQKKICFGRNFAIFPTLFFTLLIQQAGSLHRKVLRLSLLLRNTSTVIVAAIFCICVCTSMVRPKIKLLSFLVYPRTEKISATGFLSAKESVSLYSVFQQGKCLVIVVSFKHPKLKQACHALRITDLCYTKFLLIISH